MQINAGTVRRWVGIVRRVIRDVNKTKGATSGPRNRHGGQRPDAAPASLGGGSWEEGGYPGDFTGAVRPVYTPSPDGIPDPGEIVWAWIPYEEDYSRGKDRPVLLIGRDGSYLLALMLTSRDHNNEHESDPDYVDIGSGDWDGRGRESEVKVDRVIRLLPAGVRREGAVLPRQKFDLVARRVAGRFDG
ncbi:type II toxin-antitoxin system PemK/MazF family toxin [Zhihengliuella halotolerans]|uniref:PemK-like, MazF-like toxin of type II toxin-antitoxin system n=1 Tax=Zhihengliuella halotolerans TaxID=370736 RepID=A0A4V2G9Q6_9MICC|nr:type II toxin-antitoxin system PemK/MazF family toxin [Zhihengliuella halotolerans]RZU61356.1 PemK-like, MazF-like toxin of type II toxin-antitoxin system [Zhihengliuella halotolerans]